MSNTICVKSSKSYFEEEDSAFSSLNVFQSQFSQSSDWLDKNIQNKSAECKNSPGCQMSETNSFETTLQGESE